MLTPLYLIMVLICFIACSKSGSISISETEASAFVQACKDGDYGYVEKMLKLNRAFTEAKNARGETGLMHAAEEGHKNIVSILIKKGVYINTRDKDGYTALIWAADAGNSDMMELLIKKGADINMLYDNRTLLIAAAIDGQKEMAELIIRNGADVNVKNDYGRTALDYATVYGHKDIADLLIKNGAEQ